MKVKKKKKGCLYEFFTFTAIHDMFFPNILNYMRGGEKE